RRRASGARMDSRRRPGPRRDAGGALMTRATTATAPPATAAAPLSGDLTEALRRLKLATVRRLAPEVLQTAKVQRWAPEEVLRTLIEAEVAARDASNQRNRLRGAGFPVTKTLDEFKVAVSSLPRPPSTTSPASNGYQSRRIFVWSVQRG